MGWFKASVVRDTSAIPNESLDAHGIDPHRYLVGVRFRQSKHGLELCVNLDAAVEASCRLGFGSETSICRRLQRGLSYGRSKRRFNQWMSATVWGWRTRVHVVEQIERKGCLRRDQGTSIRFKE